MSDLSNARSNMRERLRKDGFRGLRAERMAEASIRRVAERINSGENPAPTDDAATRAKFKERKTRG